MPFPSSPLLSRRYRFESLIGEGAFARVYLVTHLELNVPRALKVLRRDERGVGSEDFAEYITRFQLEARLGAQLDHPHVIRIYDFEREEKLIALAMEYAAGGSLAEHNAKDTGDLQRRIKEACDLFAKTQRQDKAAHLLAAQPWAKPAGATS
jgi:serine/threonine-protein kinase